MSTTRRLAAIVVADRLKTKAHTVTGNASMPSAWKTRR
jgi:hypothetical protein